MKKKTTSLGKLKPLIDADVLRYEIGFGVEMMVADKENQVPSFESCISLLEHRIREIQEESWADLEPTMYLSADEKLIASLNRRRKKQGEELIQFSPNYREAIAVTRGYKENRSKSKPIHFNNLTHYILSKYDCKLAIGMEADDLISIDAYNSREDYTPLICSRDKDLRITPGMHYGWACGKQPSFGPEYIDELGYLELDAKGKLRGGGLMFFYSQLLTGDTVDNIPGLPGKGDKFAYNSLKNCKCESDLFKKVGKEYRLHFKDEEPGSARKYFEEQAGLLWICREMNSDGTPKRYVMYDERS